MATLKRPFTKAATTHGQQVALLQQRGMVIDDPAEAEFYLQHRAIAAVYSVDERVLESWLRHLSLVRNTCAHHSRLWNREFTITPLLPRSKPLGLAGQFQAGSRKLYNALVILLHCMDVIAPQHQWRSRLKALMARHGVAVSAMDFPTNWERLPIWQEAAP